MRSIDDIKTVGRRGLVGAIALPAIDAYLAGGTTLARTLLSPGLVEEPPKLLNLNYK